MIVVAIMGSLAVIGPNLYKNVRRFFFLSNARLELQRTARTTLSLITRQLHQGVSSSISISRASAGQPYYSQITYSDINSRQIKLYQNGKKLMMVVNSSTKTLTSDLRYLAFALPRSEDMGIVSVSVTLEKSTYEGKTKALHMASERVRVMN